MILLIQLIVFHLKKNKKNNIIEIIPKVNPTFDLYFFLFLNLKKKEGAYKSNFSQICDTIYFLFSKLIILYLKINLINLKK